MKTELSVSGADVPDIPETDSFFSIAAYSGNLAIIGGMRFLPCRLYT